jgi:hypothetical protein
VTGGGGSNLVASWDERSCEFGVADDGSVTEADSAPPVLLLRITSSKGTNVGYRARVRSSDGSEAEALAMAAVGKCRATSHLVCDHDRPPYRQPQARPISTHVHRR